MAVKKRSAKHKKRKKSKEKETKKQPETKDKVSNEKEKSKEVKEESQSALAAFRLPWHLVAAILFGYTASQTQALRLFILFWSQNQLFTSFAAVYVAAILFQGWRKNMKWTEFDPVWRTLCIVMIIPMATTMLEVNHTAQIHEIDFLSPKECDWIIERVEETTQKEGWKTSRHRYHPTEDIPVDDIPEVKDFMNEALKSRVMPLIRMKYGGDMKVFDMFIVRYTVGKQVKLEKHADAGQVSFDVALSAPEDFEGGGTHYDILGESIIPKKGRVLIHPAKLVHAGSEIFEGTRYMLVGFSFIEPKSYYEALLHRFVLWGASSVRANHLIWTKQKPKESVSTQPST